VAKLSFNDTHVAILQTLPKIPMPRKPAPDCREAERLDNKELRDRINKINKNIANWIKKQPAEPGTYAQFRLTYEEFGYGGEMRGMFAAFSPEDQKRIEVATGFLQAKTRRDAENEAIPILVNDQLRVFDFREWTKTTSRVVLHDYIRFNCVPKEDVLCSYFTTGSLDTPECVSHTPRTAPERIDHAHAVPWWTGFKLSVNLSKAKADRPDSAWLENRVVYRQAFQGETREMFEHRAIQVRSDKGKLAGVPTAVVTLIFAFPNTTRIIKVEGFERENPTPVDEGTLTTSQPVRVVLPDHHLVVWTIPEPKVNCTYRIVWEW
jgi:hypothetical protein